MRTESGFLGKLPVFPEEMTAGWEPIPSSGSGFTVLYRSRRAGRSRLYKCLKPEWQGNPVYESLLRKEFEIGFSLNHPGICEYYSFQDYPGMGRCIEMEWIEGQTLGERLSRGSLDRKTARKILLELCDALDYMHHRQVIHRDLKPDNILITDNGDNAKIIDFGFSDSDAYVIGKEPAGTEMFAAPELLAGQNVDCRCDIYSLGVIMQRMPGVPERVVRRCQSVSPEGRYASALEVKEALLQKRKFPFAGAALVLALLAGLITAAFFYYDARRNQEEADRIMEDVWEQIQEAGFPTEQPPA